MKKISALLTLLLVSFCTLSHAAERPNVVIIFIDDMGYGDVGFNGATGPKTPNLDQMAAEGMRFDDFYVGCAVCSGSRTSLMTGCHYQRLSMPAVLFPRSGRGLHPKEVTIADMLKDAGYRTACVGKWHLGHLPPCLPTYQGFESYFGVPYSNDMWIDPANTLSEDLLLREGLTLEEVKAGHKLKNWVPLMRGEEVIEYPADQKTLTKRYTEESIRFIEEHKAEPFFLYLPHTMVHLPLAVSKDFENRTGKLIWDAIEEVDWSVGEVLKTLKRLDLDEKTLVLFTSDNGAAVGSSLPLRAKKGSVYDGGIREPTVMWWPGTIPAGSVCEEVAGTIDMLPTLAGLCEGKLPEAKIDGKNIKSLMLGEAGAKSPHAHYVLMHGPGTVRSGPWKFYPWQEGKGSKREPAKKDASAHPVQLYHVEKDIGETKNVAAEHPELVARFQAAYDAHVKEVSENRRPTADMNRPAGTGGDADLARKPKARPSKSIDWSKVKIGDVIASGQAPHVAGRAFMVSAKIDATAPVGVVCAQGGEIVGYALYVQDGRCVFSLRESGSKIYRVSSPISDGVSSIQAGVDAKGQLSLQINDAAPVVGEGAMIGRHPAESFCVGHDDKKPVDPTAPVAQFNGRIMKLMAR